MKNATISKLINSWNNGNRKDVAEELSTRSFGQIFEFVILLEVYEGAEDVRTLAKLMDLYRDGHTKGEE